MIDCDDCGTKLYRTNVCNNCGLVSDEINILTEKPIVYSYNSDNKRTVQLYRPFKSLLAPDIEYSHKYAKKSRNLELNRALFWQKKERNKSEKKKYFRDYKDIQRICFYLELPTIVFLEAMNIRKWIGKKNNYFDTKTYYKNISCIKIALRIHDYPVDERDFIQMMRDSPPIEKGEKIKLRGNEIKKEINKKYIEIVHDILKINIPLPIKPNFISYACEKLKIPQYKYHLYNIYAKIKNRFNPSCSIQGYVLGLIHILYAKLNKIRIIDMEEKFGVNRLTISSRKKEITEWL